MKYKWLNNCGNDKLIVFFNGWGMDEGVVNHLDSEGMDVIMFYDYNNLDTNFDFSILKIYAEKYLVAWSMGVMTATLFDVKYSSATAINGTLYPIHDKFGIPERIYNLTLKGFSQEGAEKFIKNMYSENCTLSDINRDFENQKSELFALKSYSANKDFEYNKIMISDNDKIIPTKNQIAFWGKEPNLTGGHAIFHLYKSWRELL